MTFFDTYSFKQKKYALAIFSVLLVAVAYKKAFRVSIDTRTYRTELLEKVNKAKHADEEIKHHQMEILGLNRFLGTENSSVEKVQQGFLNFYATYANKLSVYQIEEVLNFKHPDFEINTHSIVLRGDFINTLKFIYVMETRFSLGKILNITFEFTRPSSDNEEALYTTLLMQNYLR